MTTQESHRRGAEKRRGDNNGRWNGGSSSHPLYDIYNDMIGRCYREGHPRYPDYGGRGISVSKEWRDDFWGFVSDMGDRPEGKSLGGRALWTLDRIDNDRGYSKENCRWATYSQQMKNRRPSAYSGVLRGSDQKTSKLTLEDVTYIRSEVERGPRGTQRRLAERFAVSVSLINNIVKGKAWTWVN